MKKIGIFDEKVIEKEFSNKEVSNKEIFWNKKFVSDFTSLSFKNPI